MRLASTEDAVRAEAGLAHLRRRVLQVVDLCRLLDDVRVRDPHEPAEPCVEALREVAGQLEVLALVLPHGDEGGVVEKDVRRHEHRVGEQPDGCALVAVPSRLVLELGHPAGLTEAGLAAEHPGELGVLGDVGLDEEDRALWVHTRSEELGRGAPGAIAQDGRVRVGGQRVQVDHGVDGVVLVLQRDPVRQRTEVVAEVQ
jgi:hypothetical protein